MRNMSDGNINHQIMSTIMRKTFLSFLPILLFSTLSYAQATVHHSGDVNCGAEAICDDNSCSMTKPTLEGFKLTSTAFQKNTKYKYSWLLKNASSDIKNPGYADITCEYSTTTTGDHIISFESKGMYAPNHAQPSGASWYTENGVYKCPSSAEDEHCSLLVVGATPGYGN